MSNFSRGGGIPNWRTAVDLFNRGLVDPGEVDFVHNMQPLEGFSSTTMTPGEALLKSVGNRHNLRAISSGIGGGRELMAGPQALALPPGSSGPAYSAPIVQGPIGSTGKMAQQIEGVKPFNPMAGIKSTAKPLGAEAAKSGLSGFIKDMYGGAKGKVSGTKLGARLVKNSGVADDIAKAAASSADEGASGIAKWIGEGGGIAKGGALAKGLKSGVAGYVAQSAADRFVPTESGTWKDFVKDVGIGAGTGAVFGGIPGAAIGGGVSVGAWLLEKMQSDDEKEQKKNAEKGDPTEETLNDLITLGQQTGTDENLLKEIIARYTVDVARIDPYDENGDQKDEETLAGEFDMARNSSLDMLAEIAGYSQQDVEEDQMMSYSPQEYENIMAIQQKFAQPYVDIVRQDPMALSMMMQSMQAFPYMLLQEQNAARAKSAKDAPKQLHLSDFKKAR